jgi:hypothetical protein
MNKNKLGLLLISTIFLLSFISCSNNSSEPTPNIEATVQANVEKAIQERPTNTPIPVKATNIPPTNVSPTDIQATVEAPQKQDTAATTDSSSTSSGFMSQEVCNSATGKMAEMCMKQSQDMIAADPTICDNPTGMMTQMCGMMDGVGNMGSMDMGNMDMGNMDMGNMDMSKMMEQMIGDMFNPCKQLEGFAKEMCEESFKANPNQKPTEDPNFGKADPNARLATDEVNYSEIYVPAYDPNNIPKVAKANFTELDKFSRMSKIRSSVGHDFSYKTPEYDASHANCKSMKHYFMPQGVPLENSKYATVPHTFEWMSIKMFSPVDGRLIGVGYDENQWGTEAKFTIASSEYPGYYFLFFHIALDPSLTEGSIVQAGQQIGTLGAEDTWGEIAVSAKIGKDDHRLLSFLQVATDNVLNEYQSRGIGTASDVIVTKDQRDANPLPCDDTEAGWFIGSSKSGITDTSFQKWVFESDDNWFFFD